MAQKLLIIIYIERVSVTHLNRNLVSYDNYGDIRIEENGKKLF